MNHHITHIKKAVKNQQSEKSNFYLIFLLTHTHNTQTYPNDLLKVVKLFIITMKHVKRFDKQKEYRNQESHLEVN